MKTRNRLFGGAAVLTAAGAIGAGVLISSSAMASDDGATPTDAVISMINFDDAGVGYECSTDVSQLPAFEAVPIEVAPIPEGASDRTVTATGEGTISVEAVPGGGIVDGDGTFEVIEIDPSDLVPFDPEAEIGVSLPLPDGVDVPVSDTGEIAFDTSAFLDDLEVRDGTEAECSALIERMSIEMSDGVTTNGSGITISGEAVAVPTDTTDAP